jgi:hypothetical protein
LKLILGFAVDNDDLTLNESGVVSLELYLRVWAEPAWLPNVRVGIAATSESRRQAQRRVSGHCWWLFGPARETGVLDSHFTSPGRLCSKSIPSPLSIGAEGIPVIIEGRSDIKHLALLDDVASR